MSTACLTCGAELRESSINTYFHIAKCPSCNRVFNLVGAVGGAPQEGGWVLERRPVTMPGNIRVIADSESPSLESGYRERPVESRFVIERRAPLAQAVRLGGVALFWDVFCALVMRTKPWTEGFLVFAFVLVFPLVGLYVTYVALQALFNRTRITVANEMLSIHHAPIPTAGNRSLRASELTQLYCECVPHRKSEDTFSLIALTTSGTKIEVLTRLEDPQQALYLEQALENRLGIVDRRVDVEYHPEAVL